MANFQENLAVYSQAMNLRVQRHQVLASNIANADTPDYKARDFSFEKAMQGALAGRADAGGVEMARTAVGHLAGNAGNSPTFLKYRSENQSAVDGNTVDMDVERTQLAENALQYQILTQLINNKFQGMRSALASTAS